MVVIDPVLYNLTEEELKYILAHLDVVGIFYVIGFITCVWQLGLVIYKIIKLIIKKIKERKIKTDD